MERHSEELKNTTYEIFIGALSTLSIINLVFIIVLPDTPVGQVALIMDGFMTVIFLVDFSYRLFTAESKSGYFFRQYGWADLLSSLPLPQFKLLRLFRIFRAGRLIRRFGARQVLRIFIEDRAQSALLSLLLLIMLVIEFGGMAMVSVESRAPNGNIKTASDAIWYTYVTITTVGYGETFPVTNLGRVIGIGIMTAGVALFGTLTGYLANVFLAPAKKKVPATQASGLDEDARAKLAELKQLVEAQKKAQAALESKIAEIETLL
jgi:voltage-gated potassium channel